MYLMMLLATYMSVIYGYNLSARPDYDRDVAKKKALAVLYRFNTQHMVAKSLASRIMYVYAKEENNTTFMYSNDMLYSPYEVDKDTTTTLVWDQSKSDGHGTTEYYMRYDEDIEDSADYIPLGNYFYDSQEMATKVLCLSASMEDTTSDDCDNTANENTELCTDTDGDYVCYTNSCCLYGTTSTYIISYKKIDPRWISRVSGQVGFDFRAALMTKNYSENFGFIYWDSPGSTTGNWIFSGKLAFSPAYAKDKADWESAESTKDEPYPTDKKRRTYWKMPNYIFDKNFFTSESGYVCDEDTPCLVRIQYL